MGLENVIFKLEKYLNVKISADIIKILEFCAFENESSLMSIDNDAIMDIGNYVIENPEILKETSYENVNHFKFKPGHRLLIIQLPQLIKNCNQTETNLQKIGHLRPQMLVFNVANALSVLNPECVRINCKISGRDSPNARCNFSNTSDIFPHV
ncbi:uncharacterized protein LOC129574342 [Sitodiplosis mosellana]|uniref:uncharacterized protein LOC129567690 n=1 Tax=Sitodiplosis mosellana TaxID=263140 RepID=UPI0024447205|nr:uncharacterized protein LOC129567690 [Sitodiplosis mosellana]XP_055304273.1 uncharacterized protein LOC129569462 [Sitodiplosis mosellana]XP_055312181.1 uncharacterized protein LOC129574342 [Sitodiplosis mosellana]